jgi:hypothetical protein
MGRVLTTEAEAFDIPFQFSGVEARIEELDADALRDVLGVRSGEALAVSVVAQLHRLLAADDATNRRHGGGFLTPLQIIARSSPRSCGELLERELNTRLQLSPDASSPPVLSPLQSSSPAAPPRLGRFLAGAVAEDRGGDRGRGEPQRGGVLGAVRRGGELLRAAVRLPGTQARVEGLVLGEEICGVVACEGAERKERHERLAQWARRMETGGMERVGLSYGVMMEARKLLQSRGWAGYEVTHDARGDGFFFCWHRKPLYSISKLLIHLSPN